MASLMSLPNELKLRIIEYLEADTEHIRAEGVNLGRGEEVEAWKAQGNDSLRTLPATTSDVLNLSCVSHRFRNLIMPRVLKTVVLHNTKESARFLRTLATGPYVRSVKRIEYLAFVNRPAFFRHHHPGNGIPHYVPQLEDLPSDVEDLLANLARFESLDTVVVEFPGREPDYVIEEFFLERRETREEVRRAELEVGWRAFMARIYTALAKNLTGVVKKLALKNVIAKEASVWRSHEWHIFLGGLTAFEIGLRGGTTVMRTSLSTQDGYSDFVKSLHELFFDHLSIVREVRFFVAIHGLVGINAVNIVPFTFPCTSMPNLQRLSLSYFFISNGLVDFLTSHARTLRSISFCKVFVRGGRNRPQGEIVTWRDFFETLLSAEPTFPELHEFDMGWEFLGGITGVSETEDDETRTRFKSSYAFVGATYGYLHELLSEHVESDIMAYQKFRQLTERNRKKRDR